MGLSDESAPNEANATFTGLDSTDPELCNRQQPLCEYGQYSCMRAREGGAHDASQRVHFAVCGLKCYGALYVVALCAAACKRGRPCNMAQSSKRGRWMGQFLVSV